MISLKKLFFVLFSKIYFSEYLNFIKQNKTYLIEMQKILYEF